MYVCRLLCTIRMGSLPLLYIPTLQYVQDLYNTIQYPIRVLLSATSRLGRISVQRALFADVPSPHLGSGSRVYIEEKGLFSRLLSLLLPKKSSSCHSRSLLQVLVWYHTHPFVTVDRFSLSLSLSVGI